jgi:hypothetical protein
MLLTCLAVLYRPESIKDLCDQYGVLHLNQIHPGLCINSRIETMIWKAKQLQGIQGGGLAEVCHLYNNFHKRQGEEQVSNV